MPRKASTASSRKKKIGAISEAAKTKNKTPKGSGQKPSSKSSSKQSSSKKRKKPSTPISGENDEEEGGKKKINEEDYTTRPGKSNKEQGVKNRLKKTVFRTHFRVTNGMGRKKKVYWTESETSALTTGYEVFGRKWSKILKEYQTEFNTCRTSVDLKDKYDGMTKNKGENRTKTPKKKKQKVSKKKSGEESDEELTDDQIFGGDVRVRIRFGPKGKLHKLAGAGSHTFTELIEHAQETFHVKSYKDQLDIKAGMMQGDESPVDGNACCGSVVPMPRTNKTKPIIFIVVKKLNSSNSTSL